ncbi:MAG: NAD(P)H-hydrate dehydratase, partial [Ktedonobacterales bacterium]
PSGLDADTGAVDAGALAADLTVTLAFPKTGLTLFPGAGYLGELVVGSIGLPDALAIPPGLETLSAAEARALLPARPADSNKGTYCKVMVFAGSAQFIGAAVLAGAAAARVGAGLVTIATTAERASVYAATLPEVTYLLLAADDANPDERASVLLTGLRGYHALVVGPGLSQAPGVKPTLLALFAGLRTLPEAERPRLLVDADALNALAKEPRWWTLLPAETVITPHPGEMARLRDGQRVSSGGGDRLAVAAQTARDWNLVVVLKGACPLIASPQGALRVNWSPNPALATAGTGDVLSGVIGGLLAQGCAPWEAASLGVHLHGRAGARVRERLGEAGAVATDLIPELPLTIRETRNGGGR